MEMDIKYEYAKDGKNYKVEETLVRRQDPYRDLGLKSGSKWLLVQRGNLL